jgi:AraC-like DNA-binding protein
MAVTFDGQVYPSRSELARHLALVTGRSASTCREMLQRYRDDAAAVIEVYRERAPAIIIQFDGQTFPTRSALARYLSKRTGRAPHACRALLRLRGDDAAAVLAYYEQNEPIERQRIEFDGQIFPTRIALARYLATQTGRPVRSCLAMLRARNSDGRAVLEFYEGRASRKPRRSPSCIEFDGQVYTSRWNLAWHLSGVTGRTVKACWHALRRHHDDAAALLASTQR